jgi:5-methylcytosine-specific restriction enzyme A
MPTRSGRPCRAPGCSALTASGFCEDHAKDRTLTQRYDFRRGTHTQRGYDADWQKVRKLALARDNFLCQHCLEFDGRPVPARDVDHIVTVKTAPHLRLVLANLQSLCGYHHKKKTAAEDMGR